MSLAISGPSEETEVLSNLPRGFRCAELVECHGPQVAGDSRHANVVSSPDMHACSGADFFFSLEGHGDR